MRKFLQRKNILVLFVVILFQQSVVGSEHCAGFAAGFGVSEPWLDPGASFATGFAHDWSYRYNFKKNNSQWDIQLSYKIAFYPHKKIANHAMKFKNIQLDFVYNPRNHPIPFFIYGGFGLSTSHWNNLVSDDGNSIVTDSHRNESINFGTGLKFEFNQNVVFLISFDGVLLPMERSTGYSISDGVKTELETSIYPYKLMVSSSIFVSMLYRYYYD